jgi:hypothetical protein
MLPMPRRPCADLTLVAFYGGDEFRKGLRRKRRSYDGRSECSIISPASMLAVPLLAKNNLTGTIKYRI